MDTLFLITARGGSKGVPGKNIKMLGTKPLISYSIDLARKFVSDEFICVSTDSQEIIQVAENNGLKVPFRRPSELATDTAGTYDVIKHAIDFYSGKLEFSKIVLLQPTSPFRLKKHVEACLALHETDCEMTVSVKLTKANPYQLLYIENQSGYLEKVIKGNSAERRQDLPRVYQLNGAIYIFNVKALQHNSISDFTKIKYYEMPELNSLDIDEPIDWQWAEFLLEKKIIQFDYE